MSQHSLECDILKWIAEHSADDSIRDQCLSAEVISREFTGVGCFSRLKTTSSVAPSLLSLSDAAPFIESPELLLGGGCVLFLKNGVVDLLEVYAFGSGDYPADIDQYELREK